MIKSVLLLTSLTSIIPIYAMNLVSSSSSVSTRLIRQISGTRLFSRHWHGEFGRGWSPNGLVSHDIKNFTPEGIALLKKLEQQQREQNEHLKSIFELLKNYDNPPMRRRNRTLSDALPKCPPQVINRINGKS